jgi:uncharacterized phiE125 gp8 family phage protein
MRLKLVERSDTPILSLEEVKAYLKIDHKHQDAILKRLIKLATDWVEEATGKTFLKKVFEVTHPNNVIVLPQPPILEVIEVRNKKGILDPKQYCIEDHRGTKKVILDFEWNRKPITVRYTAGFGEDPEDVPSAIKHAIFTTIEHIYENRFDGVHKAPYKTIQPWIQYHRTYQMI